MRKLIIILIVLLLFVPSKTKTFTEPDMSNEQLEAVAIAALMCIVQEPSVLPSPPDNKPDTVKECKCNNGKISYDGGTSFTDCTCKAGLTNCGCKNSNASGDTIQEPEPSVKKVDGRKLRVILVTQPKTCAPCRNVDKNIVEVLKNDFHKRSGWEVSNSNRANLQVLDLSNQEDIKIIDELGLDFSVIPTFFKVDKNGNIDDSMTKEGDMSYGDFVKFSEATPL